VFDHQPRIRMKNRRSKGSLFLSIAVLLLLTSGMIAAREADSIQQQVPTLRDSAFRSDIKSILLHPVDFELSPPVMNLNGVESLILKFDELGSEHKDYAYTFIHCNADWTPSDLNVSEYLAGYPTEQISQGDYSFNTTISYVNYQLIFPVSTMRPKISGNYILRVFDPDRDETILTARFLVLDPKVTIEGRVQAPVDVTRRDYQQQIVFKVFTGAFQVYDVYTNVSVTIIRNFTWDDAFTGVKPRYVKGQEIDYSLDNMVFDGINEYREVDIKSLQSQSMRIRRIITDPDGYDIYLVDDLRRPFTVYKSETDINGNFIIRSEDRARNHDTEADYARVHFTLPYAAPLLGGDVFITGKPVAFHPYEDGRMIYDFKSKCYEKEVLLKQGYYNYLYSFKKKGDPSRDYGLIEGNHFETGNEYAILFYFRNNASDYDQLIGLQTITTKK